MTRARLTTATLVAICALAAASAAPAAAAHYKPLPKTNDSWFWEIDPPQEGLAGLPAMTAAYPKPGSAKIWDTDLFADSNRSHGHTLRTPTAKSAVITALHKQGHYAVCYVEAGAFQAGFPDNSDFAPADYGHGAKRYQMQGYLNEWWFDVRGFKNYVAGRPKTLTGAARNIAAGLAKRLHWCKVEGQDAVEPDDIEAYDNRSNSNAPGAGWGLTRADDQGFERWLAHTAHQQGLAILQKNDPLDARQDVHLFDGALSEECNRYNDPCAGPGGDWTPYLKAKKPVLNAEYVQDGETTAKFCPKDRKAHIWGALFGVDLNRPTPYTPCWNSSNRL